MSEKEFEKMSKYARKVALREKENRLMAEELPEVSVTVTANISKQSASAKLAKRKKANETEIYKLRTTVKNQRENIKYLLSRIETLEKGSKETVLAIAVHERDVKLIKFKEIFRSMAKRITEQREFIKGLDQRIVNQRKIIKEYENARK